MGPYEYTMCSSAPVPTYHLQCSTTELNCQPHVDGLAYALCWFSFFPQSYNVGVAVISATPPKSILANLKTVSYPICPGGNGSRIVYHRGLMCRMTVLNTNWSHPLWQRNPTRVETYSVAPEASVHKDEDNRRDAIARNLIGSAVCMLCRCQCKIHST